MGVSFENDPPPGPASDAVENNNTEISLENYGPKTAMRPPQFFHVCVVCGFIYPETDLVRYQRKWYCIPQTCWQDIKGKRWKEDLEPNVLQGEDPWRERRAYRD